MQPRGRAFDRLLCLTGHRRGRRHAKRQLRQRVALGVDAGTHFLDLALGGQNPASILAAAADHDVPAARQLAVERRDIQAGRARGAHGRVPRLGDIPAGDHRAQELGIGAADADEVGHRDHTLRGRPGRCRGHLAEHDEAAPTGLLLAQQLHAGGRVLVGRHDDVLQQVAEQRLDRAFVPAIHFEVVGHRAALFDVPVGLGQQHARRVGEPGARGLELLERPQPPRRARPDRARACAAPAPAPRARPAPPPAPSRATRARPAWPRGRACTPETPCSAATDRRRAARSRPGGRFPRRRAATRLPASRSRAAPALSIECRSAVAALMAANTSLRAASTSPSSPSMSRSAIWYCSLCSASRSAACCRSCSALRGGVPAVGDQRAAAARAARRDWPARRRDRRCGRRASRPAGG